MFTTPLLPPTRARGVDVQPIARAAGLGGSIDESRPISEAIDLSVWERLMHASHDSALPVFYAEFVAIVGPRLEDEGTPFAEVTERVRRALADAMLALARLQEVEGGGPASGPEKRRVTFFSLVTT
ncbi:MAG: hypothetical protein JNK82_20920 [Myxococcaceae bacterium]|nr:hypothetical protein [Myxococcaceae bacterium]